MPDQDELTAYGFKFGNTGAHAARSMMIEELKVLFFRLPEGTTKSEYRSDIVERNALQKATDKTRKLTYKHLVDLYGMSPQLPLFRVFRHLWALDEAAQPLLALQFALVRDTLLRKSMNLIVNLNVGEMINRETIEALLIEECQDRYSPVSLCSFAKNINGTWTQAGFLSGRSNKTRIEVKPSYVNVVFALILSHLEGLTGQRMLASPWCKLLTNDRVRLENLARKASTKGFIRYKQAADIVEISFAPTIINKNRELCRV